MYVMDLQQKLEGLGTHSLKWININPSMDK